MLKRKLEHQKIAAETGTSVDGTKVLNVEQNKVASSGFAVLTTSALFSIPFWKRFFDLEFALNSRLKLLQTPMAITHIYNPIEYAEELHCAYLKRFLDGTKRVFFVGMNPGPNGMVQTGVPFGNISTVCETMQLIGGVTQPPRVHPRRPVTGLQCTIQEPSGVRIWTLFQRLAGGSLNAFGQQCFLHNFCPLAFFDKDGRNITPSELKVIVEIGAQFDGEYKTQIRNICLRTLDEEIELLEPEFVVAVGDYVYSAIQKSSKLNMIKLIKLPHPSPRAVNNQNWSKKADILLARNDLLKYIRNEGKEND